jgi:O-antigen ligase
VAPPRQVSDFLSIQALLLPLLFLALAPLPQQPNHPAQVALLLLRHPYLSHRDKLIPAHTDQLLHLFLAQALLPPLPNRPAQVAPLLLLLLFLQLLDRLGQQEPRCPEHRPPRHQVMGFLLNQGHRLLIHPRHHPDHHPDHFLLLHLLVLALLALALLVLALLVLALLALALLALALLVLALLALALLALALLVLVVLLALALLALKEELHHRLPLPGAVGQKPR